MVSSNIKLAENIFKIMFYHKAKKAKNLISKLKEPYKGTIIGEKRANKIYNNFVNAIEPYKKEYKFP